MSCIFAFIRFFFVISKYFIITFISLRLPYYTELTRVNSVFNYYILTAFIQCIKIDIS